MSNYKKVTKHPQTRQYELADYGDDYFGPHLYGIYFPSDEKVYPVEIVERTQIYDFWAEDVILAYCYLEGFNQSDEGLITFLNQIQKQYEARWENDPITGGGATEKSRVVK